MKLKEKIDNYLLDIGYSKDMVENMDTASVYIAEKIAIYAHRNQYRINGEPYINHPYSVLDRYRNFVGIVPDDYFCIDVDLLYECGVPYEGVQELCLLHDVVEDSDITIEQIADIYANLNLGKYFDSVVKKPLSLLTHNNADDYTKYVNKIIDNPVASLVKLIDLADNINPLSLNCFEEKEIERIQKYIKSFMEINNKWHFLEKAQKYFAWKSIKD